MMLAAAGSKVKRPRRCGRDGEGGLNHCRFKIKQNERREAGGKSPTERIGDTKNCLNFFLVVDHTYPDRGAQLCKCRDSTDSVRTEQQVYVK